jgi:phosphatidylglycerol---prolipoprotein diacylglyceryl transferase
MGRAERRQAEREQRRAKRRAPGTVNPLGGGQGVQPRLTLKTSCRESSVQGSTLSVPRPVPTSLTTALPPVARIVSDPPRATSDDPPSTVRTPPSSSDRVRAAPLQVTSFGCGVLADVHPQALGLTYWFDVEPEGEPHPVTIRFTGRRISPGDVSGATTFTVDHTVPRVLPGSGRIAVTTRVQDVAAGNWEVCATRLKAEPAATGPRTGAALMPTSSASGATGYAPWVRTVAPGVRIGAWPLLVALGTVVALVLQAILAARAGLPAGSVLLWSIIACLAGLVGAKLYYIVQHLGTTRKRGLLLNGMCLQGFVLAVLATLVIGAAVLRLPAGSVLDVSTPGLVLAMGIGRIGCFLGGCCAGRPTASRWGLWSSDRSLGLRRIPVQLMESGWALVIGSTSLTVALAGAAAPAGVLFVAALSAYIFGRQLLFPLRDLPRRTAGGRIVIMVVSALVLCAMVVWHVTS